MKKILLFSMIGLAGVLSAFAPGRVLAPASAVPVETTRWTADKMHTQVKFTVTHLLISEVDGVFKSFDGTMETSKDDFSDAKITFTADVSSVNTDNEKRDADLKSDNFFNAAKFPQIKFESISFTPLGNNKYTLIGNLTIRDITKVVTFDVTYGGTASMYGVHAGFKAKTKINRFDYNLKWNAMTEAGGAVVGKEVEITINADFKKS